MDNIIRISIFSCLIAGFAYAATLPDGTSVNGQVLRSYGKGRIAVLNLTNPALINTPAGRLEFKGPVVFYENGVIFQGQLAKAQVITLASGKLEFDGKVNFNENGSLSEGQLTKTHEIQTPLGKFMFKGYDPKTPDFRFPVSFHTNGQFMDGYVERPVEINTPLGRIKTVERFGVFADGTFRICEMRTPAAIDTPYGKLLVSAFGCFQDGRLQYCNLKGEQAVKTPSGELQAEGNTYFHDNGTVREINSESGFSVMTPAGEMRFDKVAYYPSGKLRYGALMDDQIIMRKKFQRDDAVIFSEKGKMLGRGVWDGKKWDYVLKK